MGKCLSFLCLTILISLAAGCGSGSEPDAAKAQAEAAAQDPVNMATPPHPDQGARGPADPELQDTTSKDGP